MAFPMHLLLPRRSLIAAAHDVLMAALSLPLALYLRLGSEAWHMAEPYLATSLLIFMACFIASVFTFGLQREVWRYVSIQELTTIAKVVASSIIVTFAILFLMQRLEGVPRSLPLLHAMVLAALLGTPRILYRRLREGHAGSTSTRAHPVYVMIAGANDHAEAFIRTMQRRTDLPYEPVALVDHKPARHGRSLRGVPIYPLDARHLSDAIALLERQGRKPRRLILTEEYMDTQQASGLLQLCEAQGMGLARLPRMADLQSGELPDAQMSLRPVAIEDLLGRAQSHHDTDTMRTLIAGRRVLVTGAGGSIGSELVRQIAGLVPAHLTLLEQSEYHLYTIDREVAALRPDLPRAAVLCDVRDAEALHAVMRQSVPEIVFHAAALKHVPLAEANPEETIRTNVFGTRHVANAALEAGAHTLVLISTDKAVHPGNVMGASKRLAEQVWALSGATHPQARMVMVRFGNVLGSTGSVVPLFQEQLRSGGPLTVTHPDMERYFMTIREAAGLVIQAAAGAQPGAALYILDMGEPVKIVTLAEQMIRLSGQKPYEDVAIVFTGLRPGEKLSEELVYDKETLGATSHPKIGHSPARLPQPDEAALHALEAACCKRDSNKARDLLHQLVPEFRYT